MVCGHTRFTVIIAIGRDIAGLAVVIVLSTKRRGRTNLIYAHLNDAAKSYCASIL